MTSPVRQFVAVAFHPGGRSYTYHYDGPDELAPGSEVAVADRDGGWKRVTVVGPADQPDFPTKAVVGPASQLSE